MMMMPREKFAFLVCVLPSREFFRLKFFSLFASASSSWAAREIFRSSSLNIHKTISFLHFFFQSLLLFTQGRKAKSSQFFSRILSVFRLLLRIITNTFAYRNSSSRPTTELFSYYLLSCALRVATTRLYSMKSVIFIIFAECKSTLHQELIMLLVFIHFWFDTFLSSLSRQSLGKGKTFVQWWKMFSFTDDDFVSQCFLFAGEACYQACSNRFASQTFSFRTKKTLSSRRDFNLIHFEF